MFSNWLSKTNIVGPDGNKYWDSERNWSIVVVLLDDISKHTKLPRNVGQLLLPWVSTLYLLHVPGGKTDDLAKKTFLCHLDYTKFRIVGFNAINDVCCIQFQDHSANI